MMKVLFIGLGSIGQRHAAILAKRGGYELLALRSGQGSLGDHQLPVRNLSSWEQVSAEKPQLAFITNPTALHIPAAMACARQGMALFLEKPIGHNTQGLAELCALCRERQLPTYVAYVLRFHPVILRLKQMVQAERLVHLLVCSG